MRRRCLLATLGVVAVAGCSGTNGTGPETDNDVTPAPVPTDEPEDRVLAPGLTAAGVDDSVTLAAAHELVLNADTHRFERENVVRDAEGTARKETFTVLAGRNAERYYLSLSVEDTDRYPVTPQTARIDLWYGGERAFLRLRDDGETTYQSGSPPFANPQSATTHSGYLRRLFRAIDIEVVSETEGGPHELLGREADSILSVAPPRLGTLSATSNERLEAVLGADGRVHEQTVTLDATMSSGSVTAEHTAEFELGGSISSPSWLSEARTEIAAQDG